MALDYPNPTATLPTQSCYVPTWYPSWQPVPNYWPQWSQYTIATYSPDPTITALQQQVARLERQVRMLKRRNARERKRR